MNQWWKLEAAAVAQELKTDLVSGLSQQEAQGRLLQYGPNQLKEKEKISPVRIFLSQFADFIVWVLIAAALVSGVLQEWIDALAIVAIVVLNAILGFLQEYHAEKSLAALRKLSSPNAKAFRDAKKQVVPAAALVPGDLIELEAGDYVPADSRLVWVSSNLSAQEASLTGESTPVVKVSLALMEEDLPLADRANMVYLGTSIASGKAKAVVIATGMQTELGTIAGMIQGIRHETTPLQKKLEEFGKWIVYLCLGLVLMVFLAGLLRGGTLIEMFLTAVSLAVAAIPEGLPAVVTIALALGVQRMVRRHALIRKLPSVETLGCATVICSDKTGTLTKNEMTVQRVFSDNQLYAASGVGYAPEGEITREGVKVVLADSLALEKTLQLCVLCNGAELLQKDGQYAISGDPTEGALLTLAAKAGITKAALEAQFPFVQEIPFDSQRKKMTILRKEGESFLALVKGAPEVFLDDCVAVYEHGTVRSLTEADRARIRAVNDELTSQAMRVLAVGYRQLAALPERLEPQEVECQLIFTGLVAMIDPPRPEVAAAIQQCLSAGIKTVMITGDHKNTAVAIAQQLGFFGPGAQALTGQQLEVMSDEQLGLLVTTTPVYARVSPEHKLRIVRAWRKRGDIVAMTGDGVNDAPAVKEADIGVAMGITGTDVTKEVSSMVITDDNFASIVAAVEEGRGIYDNIKKFIHYLLSCNTGEILVMFVSSLCGLPLPLLPIQILWVNLVTDGLPALALGMDPVDSEVMRRLPRPAHEPVITRKGAGLLLSQGAFIAFCSLSAFCFVLFLEKEGLGRARTAAFVVLACSQLFHSLNCRSATRSIFALGLMSNPQLVLATVVSFLLQMAVVYLPFCQRIFKTEALGLFDWVLVVLISSFPLWAMELLKRWKK